MIGSKKIACVIPARLKSTRFPKKMLSTLGNKPLLQWVWEAAKKVPLFDFVSFAIDAEETAELIKSFGGSYFMTSFDCLTGTDRLVELMQKKKISADIWVNWQGDDPFITPQMISDLLQSCEKNNADVWTLKKRIALKEEINNPHIPKVVCNEEGYALCFSRSTIPYYRDFTPEEKKIYYKHIGVYAFTTKALKKIPTLTPSYLEQAEQLEQYRFLSHGLKVLVHETQEESFGIDLPEHLAMAENMLSERIV
jgi:3-deoxy-manno-octulosonate cytidylyltransferase (CMP-KDO synthetase)